MSYNLAKQKILHNSNIKIENYKKNNFYGLINSFLLFFLYFFLLFLVFIDINFITSFLLIFFMSVTVYKMGFILHDCAHNSLFESQILNKGDIILLAFGGHGFVMLEKSEIIEVKQGPYAGDKDKVRFVSSKDYSTNRKN